ncbi:hypothetical protein C8R47DRAFT_1193041 [Mycena vitilis]|nr:hypothetical protein C8R47DRAFT_1193041 [Mycena vitilis]
MSRTEPEQFQAPEQEVRTHTSILFEQLPMGAEVDTRVSILLYYFDRVFTVFKLRHRVSRIAKVFIIEKKIRSLLNAVKDTPKFNFCWRLRAEMTVGNGQSARSRTYKALGVSPNATNGLVKGPSFKTWLLQWRPVGKRATNVARYSAEEWRETSDKE